MLRWLGGLARSGLRYVTNSLMRLSKLIGDRESLIQGVLEALKEAILTKDRLKRRRRTPL